MIDVREALQLLESGAWLSIAYVSFDAAKGRAGEIIRIPKCRISTPVPQQSQPSSSSAYGGGSHSVAQNHHRHFTRNVTTPSGANRKVHMRLLFSINNIRVL